MDIAKRGVQSAFVSLLFALAVPAIAQGAGVALFHRSATAYGGADFSPATVAGDGSRRDALVTQGTYNGGVCPYQSLNPAGLCLLYKEALFTESNASSSVSASSPNYVSGVSYFYANSSHPEWFLTDSSRNRIYNPGYQSFWEMDVGNFSYQNLWAQNAIAEAKQYGWNGVFADDLACWAYNTDATSVQYPTRSAWQAAVLSFITNVGSQLHAAGLKLVSNSSSCVGYPSVLHNFAAAEDGVMEEGWMRPNVDPSQSLATASSGVWGNQLSELADAEANHKYYLAELPANSSDTQGIRYGLATQLLAARGYSSFDISDSPNDYTAAFWSPDYDTARQLGTPAGAYYELSSGVYRRDFAGGSVLVNPTGATQTVALGGSYSGSGLTNAATATMPPQTGLIVTGSQSSSPTNLLSNASFGDNGLSPWETHVSGTASASASPDCATAADGACSVDVDVSAVDGYPWHVQFQQANLLLAPNTRYVLTFYAKAVEPRSIDVSLQAQDWPYTEYADSQITLTTSWQEFTITMPAQAVSGYTAVRFNVGSVAGDVWLDGVALATG